jgi:phage shock protein A
MNDLIKKLNVLVKASLNDKIGGGDTTAKPARVGRKLDNDIQALRQRINEAVEYEDEIQARIRQFTDEAARWDQQADEAVTKGDDVAARYAIEQMKHAEQRATLAQSDLREHQQATQELIQRVNTLEAVVADAAHVQTTSSLSENPQAETENAAPQKTTQIPDLGNVLRDARDKIASLGEPARTPREADAEREDRLVDSQENKATVDDDLEQRRQRLSKR